MTQTTTVSINGQEYDSATGLPLSSSQKAASATPAPAPQPRHHSVATQLHSTTQRSQTLRRQSLQKPVPAKHQIVTRSSNVKHMDIARPRHASVQRFAKHPAGIAEPRQSVAAPAAVAMHPHVLKAHHKSAAKEAAKTQPLTQTITATQVKNEAIATAVAKTHKQPALKSKFRPRQRVAAILSATLAVVLLGGYFTYLNMPALSVRVAAVQAGIDAGYPSYRPDGYALNGPVTYSNGRVAMNFKANAGDQAFTISQSKSGWDSSALLDNYVNPKAGANYIPYTEHGLTIYTFGNNAAWVNGGILYTIEGDAPLSSSQIRRLASSLL